MPKVSLASVEDAPLVAAQGVETRGVLQGERDPIHLFHYRLAPGASLCVTGSPTDWVLYVWEGAVGAGGTRLGPGSSFIVEYGAALEMIAGADGAVLLAFHLKERTAEDLAGGHVHLLPQDRVPRAELMLVHPSTIALHADSQCPTCRVWLHENDFGGGEETPLHYHTEDEVIFITGGSIRLGPRLYGPGTALAIAAGVKYSFVAGPEGLSFINFRGVAPTYITADGSVTLYEVEGFHQYLDAPQYLEPQLQGSSV